MSDSKKKSIPNPTEHELAVLKQNFGFNQFRPGQWKIIWTLIHQKRDVCGVLATGQGKSLCYQYPAILSGKCSVVISPLISLMQDQQLGLTAKHIPCEVLCGTTRDYLSTMSKVVNGEFKVIYTTPEFINGNFGFLNKMYQNNCLELIAIDEAHCISQWGHDFRPSYRQLRNLRENIPDVPVLTLTATATPTIIKDIRESLDLKQARLVKASVYRPNLSIWVKKKSSAILSDFKEILGGPEKNDDGGSTIIYTNSRKDCEHIHQILSRAGYKVEYYHAGMTDNQRREIHQNFIYDRIKMVVATIAFGMGIDKPSIRRIINWGVPANLETYYQEIGRAGRDGLDSDCYLLYSNGDLFIHKFLISKMTASKQVQEHHLHLLQLMRQFVGSSVCRQYQLLSYFEEEQLVMDMPSDDDNRCGHCDNCADYEHQLLENGGKTIEDRKVNIGPEAKLLTDLVKGLSTNYGFRNLIGILTGSQAKTFPAKLKRCVHYGEGDHHSQNYWRALGDMLIDLGYLKYTRIGGLYGGNKSSNGKVFQVIAPGPQKLELDQNGEYWVTPSLSLQKCLPQSPSKSPQTTSITEQLIAKLKQFKDECSLELNLPPYLTLSDPVINRLLQLKLPTSIDQLALVDGMNPKVVMMMGDKLLELMNDLVPDTSVEEKITDGIDNLNASQKETLKFLQEGYDFDQIISTRKMTNNTIENHLMKIYQHCTDLDYSQLIAPGHFELIDDYLTEHSAEDKLKPIKEGIKQKSGQNVSYLEIKLVKGIRARPKES